MTSAWFLLAVLAITSVAAKVEGEERSCEELRGKFDKKGCADKRDDDKCQKLKFLICKQCSEDGEGMGQQSSTTFYFTSAKQHSILHLHAVF